MTEAVKTKKPYSKGDIVNGIYDNVTGAGMHHIHFLRKASVAEDDIMEKIYPPKVVATFGVMAEDGREIMSGWKVTGYRKDTRHGVVGDPAPFCKYSQSLFDEMFAGWK